MTTNWEHRECAGISFLTTDYICLINIRSIVNKLNQFQHFIYSRSFDIITWLSNKIFDNEILPTNYSIIRKDRSSHGGNVLLAVNNSKTYQVSTSPTSLDLLTIRINSSISVIYCLVYIPPRSSNKYFQELFEFLTSFNATDDLVLLGDFNFNDINWESLYGFTPHSAKFCEIIFDLNLCQLISEPTHIHGNILDLVLTNNPDQLFDLTVHSTQPLSI